MIYLINSKSEIAKKDLRLVYSKGNYTAYPANIEAAARNLSTQYPNNKLANQRGSNKENKRKEDNQKTKDKDNITGGTAGAHIENTTTNKDTTAPRGRASLGAHVSETNQAASHPSRKVE